MKLIGDVMIKVMFVCHGNICRSPMAEFVFLDMIKKRGLEAKITASSSATSTEEIGNDIHYGTKRAAVLYLQLPIKLLHVLSISCHQ